MRCCGRHPSRGRSGCGHFCERWRTSDPPCCWVWGAILPPKRRGMRAATAIAVLGGQVGRVVSETAAPSMRRCQGCPLRAQPTLGKCPAHCRTDATRCLSLRWWCLSLLRSVACGAAVADRMRGTPRRCPSRRCRSGCQPKAHPALKLGVAGCGPCTQAKRARSSSGAARSLGRQRHCSSVQMDLSPAAHSRWITLCRKLVLRLPEICWTTGTSVGTMRCPVRAVFHTQRAQIGTVEH